MTTAWTTAAQIPQPPRDPPLGLVSQYLLAALPNCQNCRRDRTRDWDSLTTRPEAALVGAAAATFASGAQPVLAPLEASQRFMDSYAAARERLFPDDEIEVAWASGLWLAAHNARMELRYNKPPLVLTALRSEWESRLRRAGA